MNPHEKRSNLLRLRRVVPYPLIWGESRSPQTPSTAATARGGRCFSWYGGGGAAAGALGAGAMRYRRYSPNMFASRNGRGR